jgi:predicted ester cyclase
MMGDFLAAFPDLLITFDQFIAKDDFVVERYTASGTHQGPLGRLATHQSHSHLDWYQYISHWLRTHCRSLVRG